MSVRRAEIRGLICRWSLRRAEIRAVQHCLCERGTVRRFPFECSCALLSQQWNLNIQKQVAASWLVSASYLGNKGTHLWLTTQLDPAVYIPGASSVANTNNRRILYLLNPKAGAAFSSLVHADDGNNSSYNAMLLSVNHRMDKHFSVLANYTWSHCLDDGDVQSEITGGYQDPKNRDGSRGNCYTDVRQLFNLSLVADGPHFTGNLVERLGFGLGTLRHCRETHGLMVYPSYGRLTAR